MLSFKGILEAFQVWFKNRRAKQRQQTKMGKSGETGSTSSDSPPPEPKTEMKPIPMPTMPIIPVPGTAEFNAATEAKYMNNANIKKETDYSAEALKYTDGGGE